MPWRVCLLVSVIGVETDGLLSVLYRIPAEQWEMCLSDPVAPVERTRVMEQGLSDRRMERVCSMDIFCIFVALSYEI